MREDVAISFSEQLFRDGSTTMHALLCYIGDSLGLFERLAEMGPITSEQLAGATGLNERYLREWLRAMSAAEYVDFEPAKGTFHLCAEHAVVLLDKQSPFYCAPFIFLGAPSAMMVPRIIETIRSGQGIPSRDYPPCVLDYSERLAAATYGWRLTQRWIPALAGVSSRLEAGGSVLDAGCGTGSAALQIGRVFPMAKVYGFDREEAPIQRAIQNAQRDGLERQVTFEVKDCAYLPEQAFDLVLLIEVLHDAPDPLALLAGIRRALKPGACCLLGETNYSPTGDEHLGPMGKLLYSISLLYCLPTSIAAGGPGLGTVLPEETAGELANASGFGHFRKLDLQDPYLALYELKP